MKKIISIILAIALTVLTIGTNVLAESEQISLNGYLIYNNKSHGIKWTYDRSKTLTITNIPKEDVSKYPTKQFSDEKMEKYDYYGYSNYGGYSLSENFFDYLNYNIDRIVYSKGVSMSDFRAIDIDVSFICFNGQSGVLGCLGYNSMYEIDVSNFSEIGPSALEGNYNLKKINSSKIKIFRENCMSHCGLEKINLVSAETLDNAAFMYCYKLKKIKFGKHLKTIGEKSFSGTAIKKITIPNSVIKIGSQAFEGCKKLKYVNIGNKVKTLSGTFANCSNLEKIVLGTNIKDINDFEGGSWWTRDFITAFQNCKKLSSVVLKNKKKAPKISERTFENTKNGIKFYVKNKKVAKGLKKNLKGTGVKNAKIYIGKTLVYSGIN